jgi:putative peptide zinc metalloprotease protein
LLAGIVFDGATVGLLELSELTLLREAPSIVVQVTREVVFLNIGAIVFQFLIFLRTDVYALFVVATGCKNLWATKGAVARRAIQRRRRTIGSSGGSWPGTGGSGQRRW